MKQHLYSPTALLFEAILPKTPYAGNRSLRRLTAVARNLSVWRERAASRAQLGKLEARMLDDIGLSDFDAKLEAAKPFWSK